MISPRSHGTIRSASSQENIILFRPLRSGLEIQGFKWRVTEHGHTTFSVDESQPVPLDARFPSFTAFRNSCVRSPLLPFPYVG